MRITVIGTGYVGLVTGACLASLGHRVTCLDASRSKIEMLQAGKLPFYEPELETLLADPETRRHLTFSENPVEAIPSAEVLFLCVGTPALPDGRADLSAVEVAVRTIREQLRSGSALLVTKSTVPPGTGDWIESLLQGSEAAFEVVSNPEFLREGSAVSDTLLPDRIVVGAERAGAAERLRALYQPLISRAALQGREIPFLVTDRTSAELIKYAANAFLATKISFINEMSGLAGRAGADILAVARGIGLDARIGPAFLQAGIGWGGSCFPKDLAALRETAREYGLETPLLEAVQNVNERQRAFVVSQLQTLLQRLRGKTIALLGLAFKPHTDDIRDSPAFPIARQLAARGALVRATDPQAKERAARERFPGRLCDDAYEATNGADAVVLLTEWPEFLFLDWGRIKAGMRTPLILDGRNALDRTRLLALGFRCAGIGR